MGRLGPIRPQLVLFIYSSDLPCGSPSSTYRFTALARRILVESALQTSQTITNPAIDARRKKLIRLIRIMYPHF
jgi:hypothetical protein